MPRQGFVALPCPQQRPQELVDNAVPAVQSQSLQEHPRQQQMHMPSTLLGDLHEFYGVYAQLGKRRQQKQPPPSVGRSHSDDRSTMEASSEHHHKDTRSSHNCKEGPVRQYLETICNTAAAPHRSKEAPVTSTLDLEPEPPLAPSQDRRQQCAEERVPLHDRGGDWSLLYPGLRRTALPTPGTPPATYTASHTTPLSSSQTAAVEELERTQQKLAEMQRLYSYEKQAHLRQRTQQLREDAQLRQADDDITERTAQLLTDYESLVRLRDTASREHLERVLQSVADEWMRSAESLEHTRTTCETALLTRLQATLAEQQQSLAERLQQHLVSVAVSTVEAERAQHTAIEAATQEQVESFKVEYRRILEQDMDERERLMDEQVAHREAQWRTFLKEEHVRMVAIGEEAAREANNRQLETLHIAMRDITALREQLLREHALRQAQVGQEYLAAYESLADGFTAAAAETVEYVQHLQHDYAHLIRALHEEVNRIWAEKQEAVRQIEQCPLRVAETVAQQLHVVEERASSCWQAQLATEQETHRAAVLRLTRIHEEALEKVRSSSAAKEARLKEEHQKERAVWEDHVARQRERLTVAADDALSDAQAAVQKLEKDKESLSLQVHQLKDQLRLDELAHEAALQDARQAEEARYTSQLNSLEATYDAVLQQYKEKIKTVRIGNSSSGAGSATATAALKRVAELEKELDACQSAHAANVEKAVEEAVALWSARLEQCRQEQQARFDAVEQEHRILRAALLDEVQRREQALEEKAEAQRRTHQEELQNAIMKTKEDSQRALERLERQHCAAKREVEAEAESRVRAGESALMVREQQLRSAEERWQRRRTEESETALQQLTAHVAAQHAKQLTELGSQEAMLRSERVQLAQQRAVMEQDVRSTLQVEMQKQLAERLVAAEGGWVRLLEAELLQRFSLWQEFRTQEWTCVQQLHREEVRLLHEHYAAQISALQDEQQLYLSQEAESMRAREAAWAATRAASLDAYSKAAAAKLQEVLMAERTQWHTAQQQHAAERGASIEAAAARVAEHFAITETARAQLESEVRSSYLPILEQQQAMTSKLLAEQRRLHEDAVAQMQAASAELTQEQVTQFEKDRDMREREHERRVRELRQAHEEQLAAERSHHAAAREAYERAASERMQHMRRMYEEQMAELQQRCDAQASQLCEKETGSYVEFQRIRDEQEERLRAEYEKSIADLRDAFEERNQCYAELQATLCARVQAEAGRVQTRSEEKLAHFIEEHQTQLAKLRLAHEKALDEQEVRQQEALARLQAGHETDVTALVCELRKEHEATEAALQSTWEAQQENWRKLLEEERHARRAAEQRAKEAARDAVALRVASEQQQAAAYRALDEEYRELLNQMRYDVQVEREELARRCLKDEERRFATDVLQRQRTRHQSPNVQPPKQPSSSSHSSLTTDLPVVVTAPESQTPLGRRHTSGCATLSAVWTPGAPYSVSSKGSPLSILPGDPVERAVAHHGHSYTDSQGKESSEHVLQEAKQRLGQLWDVLEVPSDDQRTFLNYADTLAQEAPAAELHDALMREQRRLEAQLPLLEALTRLEYVQRQLRPMANAPPLATLPINGKYDFALKRVSAGHNEGDDAVHVAPSVSLPSSYHVFEEDQKNATASAAVSPPSKMPGKAGNQRLEQLQLHLERLTEQLRCDITQHEKEYGEVFRVNGIRVMDRL
ncbi:hypothetical protein JKF63_05102 [Porcisia hertigi]|uniref:Uncharacterized protein n=1 Tax=Porcisia hertigi TaxID=2761500 RepID=A0A836ITA9_9TRYP|nr:hypothetical protein JKF63_05102 [Porcisia hertigi]